MTYFSPALRQSYVNEKVSQYRLSKPESKGLAEQQTEESQNYILLIASVNTRIYQWNRLEKSNGLWRVTLEDHESNVYATPSRVEVISPRDEQSEYFYKRMTTFNRTYRFFFDRKQFQNSKTATFHITGPKALLRFEFDISAEPKTIESPLYATQAELRFNDQK